LVDEIAIVHEFANEGIDLPQAELGRALEITTHELILAYSHFQGYRAGIFGSRSAVLFGQREHSLNAPYTELPLLVINMVAEGTDLSARVLGSPEQLGHFEGTPRGNILLLDAIATTFLPHMLAQELPAFGIEEANEELVPLHMN
jgi:hypothetical protein